MSRGVIFDDVTDTSGNALPGISVTIFEEGTTTKATLYDARVGGNNLDNPLTTNDRGIFLAYLEPGSYDISVAAPTGTFVKPGVPALDPDDVNDLNDNIADINAALDLLDDTGALNSLQTVDTLAELKAGSYQAGSLVATKGYYAAGDGGGASYLIKTPAQASSDGDTIDTYSVVVLANGNYAVLQHDGTVNTLQFGCLATNSDNYDNLIAIKNSSANTVRVIYNGGAYKTSDYIPLKSGQSWEFDDKAFIKLTQASSIGHVMGTAAGDTVDDINIINPQIDGGDLGHVAAEAFGENGIGIARGSNIKVLGGNIKNCRRGTSDFGGKGVQVESDCFQVFVGGGLLIQDCSKAFNTQGLASANARNIIFDDIIVKDCWEIFQLDQSFSPPTYDPEQQNCTIDNIRAFNCGIKDYAGAVDTGAIVINRYSNAKIGSVCLVNESTYGTIPALIVDHQGNENTGSNIEFHGDVTTLIDLRTNASFGTGGTWERSRWKVDHYGAVTTLVRSNASGTYTGLEYDVGTTDDDSGTILQLGLIAGQTDCYARYRSLNTGNFIEGSLLAIQDSGLNLAVSEVQNFVNTVGRFGQFKFVRSSQDRIDNERDTDVQFQRNGSTKIQLKSSTMSIFIPTYADDTAAGAGGLVTNDVYKTATGDLRIKT